MSPCLCVPVVPFCARVSVSVSPDRVNAMTSEPIQHNRLIRSLEPTPVVVRFTDVMLVVMSSVILPILALGATAGHRWLV